MRITGVASIAVAGLVALATAGVADGSIDGVLKLGGVILSDEGDLSAVQETFDVHDGFAISQIRLHGSTHPRQAFSLDVRDINRDSRQGEFVYRVPGQLKLTAGYQQSRQVFDPARAFTSDRKQWRVGAQVTPARGLSLSGGVRQVAREGDRLGFPLGVESALGDAYDHRLTMGEATAALRRDRWGGAVTYRHTDFADQRDGGADRTGRVVSARLYGTLPILERWTHMVRGAYGVRELANRDLDYTLANVQYTATVEPAERYQLRYAFEGNRIDSESTGLRTDRFRNDLDATVQHPYGRLQGGYGYELNDDDRSLTSSHGWRAAATWRHQRLLRVKVDYAGRVRNDEEDLTLLQDVESSRVRARLECTPREGVAVGGGFARRLRQFPDIDVDADGRVASAFARVEAPGWGAVSADYSHSTDAYLDRAGRYETDSHAVTARAALDRFPRLRLAGGVTYLDVGKDLDIEKSIVFAEGRVRLLPGYHLEVKYNVYNYDDYILLDRYYTANVVRIDLAYDLHW